MQLRAESREASSWREAATREKYLGLSDWIRDRLNAAVRIGLHTRSTDQTWNTPPEVIGPIVEALGPIDLDPCSNERSIVPARIAWTLERDGDSLARSWAVRRSGRVFVFVNPPYADALAWVAKCLEVRAELGQRYEFAILVPARTDTGWWELARAGGAVPLYYRGRIKFLGAMGARSGALFPSALLYLGARSPARIARVLGTRL